MQTDAIKKKVSQKAVELVKNGMKIGLGSGSTVEHFIKELGNQCREGLKIEAIASSLHSYQLAKKEGIPLIDVETISYLDLTVDGADEIDPKKRMIKGGGGAHVREKIVATMSRELIVIIDESKLSLTLGRVKLPVEVLDFAKNVTLHHIQKAGYQAEFRKLPNATLFISDNGNPIIDLHLHQPCENPEEIHKALVNIPGVVDTGFFFHLAGRVIVGFKDGQIVIYP